MTFDIYVFWGFWNIFVPLRSGSSSSIFINIAVSISNFLCPLGSSSSIFINIAISIANFLCPLGSSSSIFINIVISIANFLCPSVS